MAKSATTKKKRASPAPAPTIKGKSRSATAKAPVKAVKSAPKAKSALVPASAVEESRAVMGVQPLARKSPVLLFHNLNQMITDIFDAETGGFPTTTQFELFNAIQSMDGPTQTALGVATRMDRSTVAEVLKRMQARHAINRVRVPTDERALSITLTEKGLDALERGKKAMRVVEERLKSAAGFTEAAAWATTVLVAHEKRITENGKNGGPSPKIARTGPVGGNFDTKRSGSGTLGSARTRPFGDDDANASAPVGADA